VQPTKNARQVTAPIKRAGTQTSDRYRVIDFTMPSWQANNYCGWSVVCLRDLRAMLGPMLLTRRDSHFFPDGLVPRIGNTALKLRRRSPTWWRPAPPIASAYTRLR
jgi:hypothetical protein